MMIDVETWKSHSSTRVIRLRRARPHWNWDLISAQVFLSHYDFGEKPSCESSARHIVGHHDGLSAFRESMLTPTLLYCLCFPLGRAESY